MPGGYKPAPPRSSGRIDDPETRPDVGGILAPKAIGLAYGSIRFGGVFVMATAVLAAGVLAGIVFGLSTASRTLEDISAEGLGTGVSSRG